MSKQRIGDACAYIPGLDGGKAQYRRIGTAFAEDDGSRISIKIDTLPINNSGWTGWVNIFPDEHKKKEDVNKEQAKQNASKSSARRRADFYDMEDDIPF